MALFASYKTYLETANLEDVPRDTLRRAKKRAKRAKDQNVQLETQQTQQQTQELQNRKGVQNENVLTGIETYCESSFLESVTDARESVSGIDRITDSVSDICQTNRQLNLSDEAREYEIRSHYDESTHYNMDTDDYNDDSDRSDNDTKNLLRLRNLDDFIENEDFWKSISTRVNKSPGEIFIMVLKFILTYKLSLTAASNLFNLVNCLFTEPVLPDSRYILEKLLNSKTDTECHGICPVCGKYLGKSRNLETYVTCDICSLRIDLSKPSLENVFLVINPSDSIKSLINTNDKYYDFVVSKRKFNGQIEDIYDGKCYRQFVKDLSLSEKTSYITGIINTDGAPRFECSKYAIWPVYLLINELPVQERLNNAILIGIWFGKDKPPMQSFLQPIVNKIEELSQKGIECNIQNNPRLLKLYVLVACVDSVARAPMQGLIQFNGHFGCSWCLHEGQWYEGSIRYPVLLQVPEERIKETTLRCMEIICSDERGVANMFGIKYVSPLINVTNFDVIKGFVPDYLHCILAGVGKQITEVLLKTVSTEAIIVLDTLLKNIKKSTSTISSIE